MGVEQRDSGDLFFDALVRAYVEENPRFLRRSWLARELDKQLAEKGRRYTLLTAEPGAGKSAFLAQLASDHPDWLRYFIRRDQRSVLADVSDKSLLLRIGYQLVARQPELFTLEQLRVSVKQRIGRIEEKAQAIGAEIKRLTASPFYQRILEVDQQVRSSKGTVAGLRVEELIVEARLLPAEDLLFLALVQPARALQRADPAKQIVILIDALDEIRYHPKTDDILAWLSNCPALPENIRFVVTSRPPDEELKLFCAKQRHYLGELAISVKDKKVQQDLQRFVTRWVREPALAQVLRATAGGARRFVQKVTAKACGNLGYVDALARGTDQALLRKDSKAIKALLGLRELPGDLEGLYAFFLHQIKASVARERVELKDPETGETYDKPVWPAVYDRMLGVLAVTMEPLDVDHIVQLGGINAERAWVNAALERLLQFLQITGDHYRFYHATVADFLTAETTRTNPETKDLYQDAEQRHRQIADYYWQKYHEDWEKCHEAYALNYLSAHLVALGDGHRARALICEKWMLARRRHGQHLGSVGFIDDIGRAWSTAITEPEGPAKLVELFRLQTAQQAVSHQTTVHSDRDLETLVWFGRVEEAIALCGLRAPADARYSGLKAINTALNQVAETNARGAVRDQGQVDKWQRQLLNEAELAARDIRADEERAKALAEVAAGFGRIGDAKADALFDEARQVALDRYYFEDTAMSPLAGGKVGVWAVRDVVEVLIKAKRYQQAEALARNVFGSDSLFDELFRTAAVALGNAGNFVEAERVARTLRSSEARGEALSHVVRVLTQAHHFKEAERVARSIELGQDQMRALSTLAAGLAQAKDEGATKLFEELQLNVGKLAGTHQGQLALTLSAGLAAAARYGDAEKLIRSIVDTERRAEALIRLAQALAQAGDARAIPAFDEALAVTRTIEEESRRSPKVCALIDALVEARAFPKAEITCDLLPKGWDRAQALRKLASALACLGDSKADKAIPAAWVAAQDIEDPRLRALSLFELALVIGPLGDPRLADVLSEARDALNKVNNDQTRLDELSSMAHGLARKGLDCAPRMLEYAIAARRELAGGKEPDLRQIATLLLQANCYAKAEQLARLIASPEARAGVLRTLGETLAAMEDDRSQRVFAAALQATESIPSLAERAQERCILVEILARWKAPQTSQALDRALTEVRLLQDPYQIASQLCSLALAAAKAGLDQGLAIFAGAISRLKDIKSPQHDALARKELAEALVSCGYYEKSEQIAQAIADEQLRSMALGALALGLAQDGHSSKAQRVARAVDDSVEKVRALAGISSALTERGDVAAGECLDEAVKLARAISDPRARAGLLCDLGWQLAQTGEQASRPIFGEALRTAQAIADPEARAEELIRLGWTLCHAGDSRADRAFARARSAIEAIEGPLQGAFELSMKGQILCYLASALSLNGRFTEASDVAHSIEDEAWRAIALREVASALAEKGNVETADPFFDEAERQLQVVQNHNSWRSGAHSLVVALAKAGRYEKVFGFLKSVDLDTFLAIVLNITPGLERLNPGVTLNLLREICGVAGWVRPRWRRVHEVLCDARTLDGVDDSGTAR